ncbi:peptidyl-prolyl cis-trans isomerase B (cyclophilin B) [Nonomuraea solani]|uniref:Peptidyl-prolyl cis-trans isomerase B (Cyclophilin B) n=1 Tax=Nonomuraea solani TaxID=1144553 RepID=A0A1H6DZ83_9ACTN|nr:peptidylprolyl isomerase [Nonomuraea solani]SEG90660.1 peptidyl-prolyl cis-trans isomerase B (cyclophilin B) [Nonomuraea solani]
MSGDDRQNEEDRQAELAREHKERQAKRASDQTAKARRNTFIGAGVAVVVVAAGVFAATTLVGNDKGAAEVDAAARASASASPSTSSGPLEPAPSITPTKTGPVSCAYKRETAVPNKFVGLPGKRPNMKLKKMTIEFNRGKVVVDLMTAAAPCSVNSMSFLSKKKFYDNMKCHRLVTPDVAGVHMLQCGDPLAKADGKNPTDGQGTSGYVFTDENIDIPVGKGVVFLTQAGDAAGQNNSQFAFSLSDENVQIGAGYNVLGMVSEGMDTLLAMATSGKDLLLNDADITGDGGTTAPKNPVIIKRITFS